MAQKALRPCLHPGCAELTRDGYCSAHKPKPAARRDSAQWHSWYRLPIWRNELRPEQLLREPFCRECGKLGVRTFAVVVDHVSPFRGDWGLFVDPKNHQSLCKYHHDRKTVMEQAERRQEAARK